MFKDTIYILKYYNLNPIFRTDTDGCFILTLPEVPSMFCLLFSRDTKTWKHTDWTKEGLPSLLATFLYSIKHKC